MPETWRDPKVDPPPKEDILAVVGRQGRQWRTYLSWQCGAWFEPDDTEFDPVTFTEKYWDDTVDIKWQERILYWCSIPEVPNA